MSAVYIKKNKRREAHTHTRHTQTKPNSFLSYYIYCTNKWRATHTNMRCLRLSQTIHSTLIPSRIASMVESLQTKEADFLSLKHLFSIGAHLLGLLKIICMLRRFAHGHHANLQIIFISIFIFVEYYWWGLGLGVLLLLLLLLYQQIYTK